jgi:hypothetical protein
MRGGAFVCSFFMLTSEDAEGRRTMEALPGLGGLGYAFGGVIGPQVLSAAEVRRYMIQVGLSGSGPCRDLAKLGGELQAAFGP